MPEVLSGFTEGWTSWSDKGHVFLVVIGFLAAGCYDLAHTVIPVGKKMIETSGEISLEKDVRQLMSDLKPDVLYCGLLIAMAVGVGYVAVYWLGKGSALTLNMPGGDVDGRMIIFVLAALLSCRSCALGHSVRHKVYRRVGLV